MAIIIQVNGNSVSDGFLVAPDGASTFSVLLNLSTDNGTTVMATIDATPNGAGIVLPAGNISISPAGMNIPIHATGVSNIRGDTVINVHVGATTTRFTLTAIAKPEIWYRGRFQARFATDGDYYNNPRGNDGGTVGFDPAEGPGWTWALEGEPDFFVPSGVDSSGAPNSVPTSVDKPVGRVVRLNNPVNLRSHAAPIGTTVNEIHGVLANSTTQIFTVGDPVIGATVNLGPDTYFAANYPKNPADPWPAEPPAGPGGQPVAIEGDEPMALFEYHIDGFLSGKSAKLGDRPTANGIPNSPADERAAIGYVPLATFNNTRLAQLQADFNALSTTDQTGTNVT